MNVMEVSDKEQAEVKKGEVWGKAGPTKSRHVTGQYGRKVDRCPSQLCGEIH
jgi:hypothetical protein